MQYRAMVSIICVAIVLVEGAKIFGAPLDGPRKVKGTPLNSSKVEVTGLLHWFDQSGDILALKKALALVESVEPARNAAKMELLAFRVDKLKLLLAIFNHIDAKLRSDFDFETPPLMNVAPRPETGLPAGVDPKSISDSKIRAQYEKDIADNQAKTEIYNFQYRLREIARACSDAFERHISLHYSKSSEEALVGLIDETVRSKSRKVSLKALISTIFIKPR
jgi:hypothetical protein